MAAAAGPKSIGLRFKPCLPLRLQRVRDAGLVDPIDDHWDAERALLAALLSGCTPA